MEYVNTSQIKEGGASQRCAVSLRRVSLRKGVKRRVWKMFDCLRGAGLSVRSQTARCQSEGGVSEEKNEESVCKELV